MLDLLRNKPAFIVEAEKARFKPNIIVQVLVFVAVFIVTQIAAGLPLFIGTIVKVVSDMTNGTADLTDPAKNQEYASQLMSGDWVNILMLFCTVIATTLAIIYCRFIEKRSLFSMGFTKRKAVSNYLTGLLVGALMFGAGVLICWLTGTLEYKGLVLGSNIGMVLVFFLGFLCQGMSEEVILRGYFMVSLAAKKSVIIAILLNSVLFALMHIFNNGISILPLINLALFGIFASVYMLCTENIWGVCAIHSVWNFVQGNVFGIAVSGIKINATVFSFESNNSNTLINGGEFGLEGGLAVTAVLVIATVLTLLIKSRSNSVMRTET